jgi:hypothetical protein
MPRTKEGMKTKQCLPRSLWEAIRVPVAKEELPICMDTLRSTKLGKNYRLENLEKELQE